MSAEASIPPVHPPHRPDQRLRREPDPVSDDPGRTDPSNDTESDDENVYQENAGQPECFGKPVVAMEPGAFRLPEVLRHIQAGRVVLLIPSPRPPQAHPPRTKPPPAPTAT